MVQDADNNLARELFALSDSDPAEAIDRISRLDANFLSKPIILFCRFNALRHLAANRLAASGIKSISSDTAAAIREHFGPAEERYARSAIMTISEIEAIKPNYVVSRDFVQEMVDQLASLIELYAPGWAQQTLGWTKMARFADGVRIHADIRKRLPEDLMQSAMGRRFCIDDIVTSAIGAGGSYDRDRGPYADFMLLFRIPQGDEKVEDVLAGTFRYYQSDEAEYTSAR